MKSNIEAIITISDVCISSNINHTDNQKNYSGLDFKSIFSTLKKRYNQRYIIEVLKRIVPELPGIKYEEIKENSNEPNLIDLFTYLYTKNSGNFDLAYRILKEEYPQYCNNPKNQFFNSRNIQ